LGRELDAADGPSLDRIVANATNDDFRFRTMIREVILSASFRDYYSVAAEKN